MDFPSRSLLVLLGFTAAALVACDHEGSGGGGNGGGGAAGTGGDGGGGGATVTETHGCPSDIYSVQDGDPCFDPGLLCNVPHFCPASGREADCIGSGAGATWRVYHWDTWCQCPETLPVAGDACDDDWDNFACDFDVTTECGAGHVTATCEPDAAGVAVWLVTDPVCP